VVIQGKTIETRLIAQAAMSIAVKTYALTVRAAGTAAHVIASKRWLAGKGCEWALDGESKQTGKDG
jgi:hypothetical protein